MQILHGGALIYGIVVRNASHDPVYDLRATCHGFTRDRMPTMQCVPPGEYFIANTSIRKSDGRIFQWDYAKPREEIADPVRPFTASRKLGVDMLTFRDRAGLDWVRTPEGALRPSVDGA